MKQGIAIVCRPLVIRSFETLEGDRCVDIFRRSDGSFGFEGYRRDMEDPRGWYPVGHFADGRFMCEGEATDAAVRIFPWIAETT